MKKLNYLFVTAAMMVAMVFVSWAVDDLPVDPNEPKIHDGDELATAIAQYTEVVNGVPVLTLPAGVSVVLNEPVELNAPLLIVGADASAPAQIKVGAEGKFVTFAGIDIMNAVIDASDMANPLVTVGVDEPAEWELCPVNFMNVKISGLKKALVYAACKKYDAELTVADCNIQVASDVTVFDFTKGSTFRDFEIVNSTIWAPEATSKSLYSSQGGQKATELDENAIQSFRFTNSTFYNLTKSKNFFSHRQSNQKWLEYSVKDCIFVNCGKSGQAIKGMNGGQGGKNPVWTITGNVFNFDDADTSADESTGDDDEPVKDSKAVVVKFADAANGDFTQAEAEAGDPRWIK